MELVPPVDCPMRPSNKEMFFVATYDELFDHCVEGDFLELGDGIIEASNNSNTEQHQQRLSSHGSLESFREADTDEAASALTVDPPAHSQACNTQHQRKTTQPDSASSNGSLGAVSSALGSGSTVDQAQEEGTVPGNNTTPPSWNVSSQLNTSPRPVGSPKKREHHNQSNSSLNASPKTTSSSPSKSLDSVSPHSLANSPKMMRGSNYRPDDHALWSHQLEAAVDKLNTHHHSRVVSEPLSPPYSSRIGQQSPATPFTTRKGDSSIWGQRVTSLSNNFNSNSWSTNSSPLSPPASSKFPRFKNTNNLFSTPAGRGLQSLDCQVSPLTTDFDHLSHNPITPLSSPPLHEAQRTSFLDTASPTFSSTHDHPEGLRSAFPVGLDSDQLLQNSSWGSDHSNALTFNTSDTSNDFREWRTDNWSGASSFAHLSPSAFSHSNDNNSNSLDLHSSLSAAGSDFATGGLMIHCDGPLVADISRLHNTHVSSASSSALSPTHLQVESRHAPHHHHGHHRHPSSPSTYSPTQLFAGADSHSTTNDLFIAPGFSSTTSSYSVAVPAADDTTSSGSSAQLPRTRKPTGQRKRGKEGQSSKTSPRSVSTPHAKTTPTVGFVDFTIADSRKILGGVAPSGSSKTKARREREAAEKRKRLVQEALKAVQEAGGDIGKLETRLSI